MKRRVKKQYIKLGGGVLRFGTKTIHKGEYFEAYEDEISESFRDLIKPVKIIENKKEEEGQVVDTVELDTSESSDSKVDSVDVDTSEQNNEIRLDKSVITKSNPQGLFIHSRGYGWYDIKDKDDEKHNETPMRKKEATEAIRKLTN